MEVNAALENSEEIRNKEQAASQSDSSARQVLVIIGTGRPNSKTEKIARYVLSQAIHFGFDAKLISPQEAIDSFETLGTSDIKKKAWSDVVSLARGYVIVAPEYNHGYPGELKLMLDQAYKEYAHKPLGIVGVSSGILGGARMVEQLRLVGIELSMIPVRNAVYIREVQKILDDAGNVQDDTLPARLQILFEDINWYITQLNK